MEIEAKDGTTTIPLNQTSTTDFGRGLGFNNTNDRTVSRRHVTFKPQSESMARFEVIGRNPMWVRSGRNGETKFFRSGDEGEMEGGDLFCVSGKTPVWFGLKKIKVFEDEVFERLETSSSSNGASVTSFEPVDVSDTDPVKEFGFLVMGHEFDCYSKQMIRDMKNWNWFLEEARKDSDDEDVSEKKGSISVKKKRKNAGGIDDDDEWTGESEDDKDLISKPRKFPKPNYSTRSKHCSSKPPHDSKNSTKNDVPKKSLRANEEESEDEDKETLGGFIVDEEDVEQEEESEEDEEEEEEFDEDDDDEEIND